MYSEELETILEKIEKKFNVETAPLRIGGKTLKVLQIGDFTEYVEKIVERETLEFHDLPYWAKLWDASFVLAYFLGRQPVVMGQRMLEIGAGLGIVGVYAALCGHNVTITDVNEDALLFSRANVLLNECPQVSVRRMDWNDHDPQQKYDVIFGSEVVYDRDTYPALVQFLARTLSPSGVIFLAKHSQLPTPKFFVELTKCFKFKQKELTVGEGEERQRITLYAVKHKNGGC